MRKDGFFIKAMERLLLSLRRGPSSGIVAREKLNRLTIPQKITTPTPARQLIHVRRARKIMGAEMAPTAKVLWRRLEAAGLPPDRRLTMRLSKLLMLPRPMP